MSDLVLLTVDSLRQDHLGCYGYHRDTSPNIDALAESGQLFENAFSNGNATRSSFPSIMTSTYPMMYGGYEVISREQALIAEVLQQDGYATGGFHSNPYLSADFGYDRGFNRYHDWRDEPSLTAKVRQYIKNNLNNDSLFFKLLKTAFNKTEEQTGIEVGSLYTDARETTDEALSWVRANDDSERFLWVHYMDVHHPYNPPGEYQLKFRDEPISDREAKQLRRRMLESPEALTEDERQCLIDLYDAEIAFVDSEIARLIKEFDDSAKILFTADHGEEFGDHGRYSHHETFYDENIHIPLIIRTERTPTVHDNLTCSLDIGPTIVDLAGLEIPSSYLGRSLATEANLNPDEDRDWIMSSVDDRFMCRSNRWKYITQRDGPQLLFDLETDPNETKNIAESNPDFITKFEDQLETLRERVQSSSSQQLTRDIDEATRKRLQQLGYKE